MITYYIYHHLGLGDSFICNGLVRYFADKFGKVTTFAKTHNFDTVRFMYADNENITVLPVDGDNEVIKHLNMQSLFGNQIELIRVGFEYLWCNAANPELPHYSPNPGFDVRFYEIVGIGFDKRWTLFNVKRYIENEKRFFEKFNVKEKEYIFVHDDGRYQIDINRIDNPNNLPIIRPSRHPMSPTLSDNMFDYCYLIENAYSVHTIESSFQFMIDSLGLNEENYAHRYARFLTEGEKPIYKTVKEILI